MNPTPQAYACGSRYCAVCGQRWQGDQRLMAVTASEHVGSSVALITVTAPGDAYFRDDAWRWVGGPWVSRRWWNDEARGEWRLFHQWASRPLRAWAREHAPGWRVLFRSWEYQKRGLLHLHLVLPFGTPEERRVTTLYVNNLWAGARGFGFGYVLGGDTSERPGWRTPPRVAPASGPDAARYVCKYVAATGAGKEGMVQVAQRTAQRGSVLYVSRTLTQRTGITMTSLRARRRIWVQHPWARGGGDAWEVARLIDSIQRGRPRLVPGAVLRLRMALTGAGAGSWVDARTGEQGVPTVAPAPAKDHRTAPPSPGGGGRAAVTLAPVLLRVPREGDGRIDGTVLVSVAV